MFAELNCCGSVEGTVSVAFAQNLMFSLEPAEVVPGFKHDRSRLHEGNDIGDCFDGHSSVSTRVSDVAVEGILGGC